MSEQTTSNKNDHRVVTFTNKTDFAFTPELGCMYDSNPIFGKSGTSVEAGESVVLPYHIGNLLAKNLAKQAMMKVAPEDAKGIPTGEPIWSEDSLEAKRSSYIEDMYEEEKPTTMSETDKLMEKVEEYKGMVDKLLTDQEKNESGKDDSPEKTTEEKDENEPVVYQDKADVLAELDKRGITHDKRKGKVELEKLLVN
jgi:hypothetical protein